MEKINVNQLLLAIARHEIGVKEIPGRENNSRILYYAKRAGLTWVKNDETSWCGIFMGFCFSEVPECLRPKYPKQEAARARAWLDYGAEVKTLTDAKPGDVLIFWRGSPDSWQGHVTIFIKQAGNLIYCLGGNQKNMVRYSLYSRDRLLGIRRY